MSEKEFKQRLLKCNKDILAATLYRRVNGESLLRTVELYTFQAKSKKILNEMDELTRIGSEIKDITSLEIRAKWLKNHDDWVKKNDELKELEAYHERLT